MPFRPKTKPFRPTIKLPKAKPPTIKTRLKSMIRSRRLRKFFGKVIGGSMIIADVLPDVVEQIFQAAAVCNDCFQEFEKIWNDFDEKVDLFCEKYHPDFPEWYDDKNKNCTEQGAEYYYFHKGFEVFDNFGADNNSCLKAKSEYFAEIKTDSNCREGNDRIQGDSLRCLFDIAYQPEEAEKSCTMGMERSDSDNINEVDSGIDYYNDY